MVSSLGSAEYLNPTQSPNLTMSSSDGRYRVRVGCSQLEVLLAMCRESATWETGGLLVGRYNDAHDTATVTRIWGPPKDSVRKRTSFRRGTRGLQKQLDSLWRTREYYLGEWHYHPGGAGQPSTTDISEMLRIAKALQYNTPEPILIVVGGLDWKVVAHVFPRHGKSIELTGLARSSQASDRDLAHGPSMRS